MLCGRVEGILISVSSHSQTMSPRELGLLGCCLDLFFFTPRDWDLLLLSRVVGDLSLGQVQHLLASLSPWLSTHKSSARRLAVTAVPYSMAEATAPPPGLSATAVVFLGSLECSCVPSCGLVEDEAQRDLVGEPPTWYLILLASEEESLEIKALQQLRSRGSEAKLR